MNPVRKMRMELGLSQREMAELLSVHRSVLNNMEHYQKRISKNVYRRLEEIGQALKSVTPDAHLQSMAEEISMKQESMLRDEVVTGRIRVKHMKAWLDKMKSRHAAASKALIMLGDELRVFQQVTDYAAQLRKQKEEAMAIYLETLPCRQQLLVLKISSLECRLDLVEKELGA